MTAGESGLELGVIGNCQIAALIDHAGRLIWSCLPRLDGDPFFCALLTREHAAPTEGVFAIEVRGLARTEQAYVRNSAILETTLHDAQGGAVRIVDFCPRFRWRGRMFRPTMIVRLVEPLAGRPIVSIRCRPRCDYGAKAPTVVVASHHIRFTTASGAYRLTTDASLAAVLEDRPIVLDRPIAFVLGPDETLEQAPATVANSFLEQTRTYWQDWVRTLAIPFEWQSAVIRAAITLKLCTYEDTGAVIAALTTSVPESPGSGRNWDYRYCWLRDAWFVIQALNRLGATRTMEAYLHFIDNVAAAGGSNELQPLYGVTGIADLDEREVRTLDGYEGMGPVRVGNDAFRQRQNDVYGSVILASTHSFFDERLASPGDLGLFERLAVLGERAVAVHDTADAGPWEFRGITAVHTFSAVMCWAGCDRLARIAGALGLADRMRTWTERASVIRKRVLEGAWSPSRQVFASSFGGTDVDATALLFPELGFVAPNDPRFLSTLRIIERELMEGHWLFRHRHADDFGTPATAFTICAFWYVNALALVGRVEEGRERFDQLLQHRTRLGLLSEDISLATRRLWGNFPQTYSMVGIINAAMRLSRPWESVA